MPIFINVGYPKSVDGKEWKHFHDCRLLAQREDDGFAVRRLRNTDAVKGSYAEHQRRRCPICMPDDLFSGTEPHNPDH